MRPPGPLVATLTLALSAAVAVPLALPPTASASGGPAVTATVVLRAPDSSPLAAAGGLPRAARLGRLAALLPSPNDVTAVRAEAQADGLTVLDGSDWSLSVRGPAGALAALRADPRVADVLSGGPAPAPAASTSGPVAVPLSGADLRAAYDASGAQRPADSIQPVVATLQFSGWNSAELAAYVANANSQMHYGLTTPPRSTFAAVSADGSSTTAAGPDSTEFALDQESIYGVAPWAAQRAYVGSPSPAGMVAALDKVATDAIATPGMVALSISYVFCLGNPHSGTGLQQSDEMAIHEALSHVVASGVTVFAATGDTGAQCDGQISAAYPAADPQVIAVGGTTLQSGPLSESAWSFGGRGLGVGPRSVGQQGLLGAGPRQLPDIAADADLDTGFYVWHDAGDGSGQTFHQVGGTSLASAVSAAAYSAELGSRGAANGGLGDISSELYSSAAAADFRAAPSGATSPATSRYDLVTGLGAPQWSPLLDQLLVQPVPSVPATSASRTIPVSVTTPGGQAFSAWDDGYGNPPPTCGSPTGHPAAPAPVTVPSDGTFVIWLHGWVAGHCFTVMTTTTVSTAAPAPSPAPTTLAAAPTSSPVAVASVPPVIVWADVTPPTVAVTAKQRTPAGTAISYSWKATDGHGSGIASVVATVLQDGRPVWVHAVGATGGVTLPGRAGHAYQLSVLSVDVAGNAAAYRSGTVRLPLPVSAFALSKGWSRVVASTVLGGRALHASRAGATASVTTSAKTFALLASTGPGEGLVAVYVDGHHVRDVSLYAARAGRVAVMLDRFSTAKRHHITLRVKGTHVAKARGSLVVVDGLLLG